MASTRKAPRFDSSRYLTLQKSHIQWTKSQKKKKAHLGIVTDIVHEKDVTTPATDPAYDPPATLDVGQEQLYSFYAPSLESILHHITVTQHIIPPAGSVSHTLDLHATQDFEVIGPRFSLPDGDVQTVYPPQGHGDHLNILPHVVFNDPHLPWERPATASDEPDPERNRVPWLALLVFTQDELRLLSTQLGGPNKIFASDKTQSSLLSISMTITELLALAKTNAVVTPVFNDETDPIDQKTLDSNANFIFVPSSLFESFVCSYKADGSRDNTQTTPNVSRYKYLTHVRNITTDGMAVSGSTQEPQQLLSIIMAHRTGPWTITQPTPVVVHLVSIEGVESQLTLPIANSAPFVALCSLYSWTYQCLPPDSLNFFDAMKDLCNTVSVLRPASNYFDPLTSDIDPVRKRVGDRLRDGYSLTKYRVQTGEMTAALTRGPFVPTVVPHDLTVQSSFSTDLQILDQTIGIMDISYSVAWQLGRTMAIADQSFTTAVSRLRTTIQNQAMNAIKVSMMGDSLKSFRTVVPALRNRVQLLGNLQNTTEGLDPLRKWQRPSSKLAIDFSFWNDQTRAQFLVEAKKVTKSLAASTDSTENVYQYYNEHNSPASSDWALVLKWVLDRMSFNGIPAHYLITDPTHLPRESLRLFAVDPNWVDALIDGALSIANHLEGDDDQMRVAIKSTLTDYFDAVDPHIRYAPQIPKSGFLLHSAVVKQFPDLVVIAPRPPNDPIQASMAPILRQENIAEDVMLVLFDRVPGDGLLTTLTLSQPPHQQCFVAADNIGPQDATNGGDPTKINFEFAYKQVYSTVAQPTGDTRKTTLTPDLVITKGVTTTPNIFDWDARTLIFPNWAQHLFDTVKVRMPSGTFMDDVPSAALVGIQQNDSMYQIEIKFPLRTSLVHQASASKSPLNTQTIKMTQTRDRFQTAKRITELKNLRNLHRPAQSQHQKPTVLVSSNPRVSPSKAESHNLEQNKKLPSPHSRPTVLNVRTSTVNTLPALSSITPQLKLSCRVASSTNTTDPIPTQTGYPIDLIFSVQYVGDAPSLDAKGYRFSEIRFVIPVGPVAPVTPTKPANLLSFYDGLSGRMLSNLRWNPLVVPGATPDVLYLSLLPRSTNGVERLLRNKEMSFVLNEVNVNAYTRQVPLAILCYEIYAVGIPGQGGTLQRAENHTCKVTLAPAPPPAPTPTPTPNK
ncbi:MAG: hypothetical protein MMC33_005353 [Icmadophila ericetorum]|nr:hypothetical protein [Icmadophila ericetorum]